MSLRGAYRSLETWQSGHWHKAVAFPAESRSGRYVGRDTSLHETVRLV